jgi:enolase
MPTTILEITGREVIDSRGNPTVEVDVRLEGGALGRAAVPSGASTGEHEAWELRDGDKKRYLGKGVLKAVAAVNNVIAPELEGHDACQQAQIDNIMNQLDGTANKAKLGANAILGVSLAVAKAAAAQLEQPLYALPRRPQRQGPARADDEHHQRRRPLRRAHRLPGVHDHAQGRADFPRSPALRRRSLPRAQKSAQRPRASAPPSATRAASLRPSSPPTTPSASSPPPSKGRLQARQDIFIALDVASSEFYDKKKNAYVFKKSTVQVKSAEELVAYYAKLQKKYPIISIEDGCAENDWAGWKVLTDKLGAKTQLVGDDLFVTNVQFLQKGIDQGVANSILVKVNQIGSLTETLDAVELATATPTPPCSATAPAKPRTPPSPTSPWPPTAARSKPARSAAPTGSPNTTSSSASRRNSADEALSSRAPGGRSPPLPAAARYAEISTVPSLTSMKSRQLKRGALWRMLL